LLWMILIRVSLLAGGTSKFQWRFLRCVCFLLRMRLSVLFGRVSKGNSLDIKIPPFICFHNSGWHFLQSPTSGEQQSIYLVDILDTAKYLI
jgi:hypothetical protein